MQAGGDRAARVPAEQGADRLPGDNGLTGAQHRGDRLIGGAQAVGVVDADHRGTRDGAGERDHSGTGGVHHLAE